MRRFYIYTAVFAVSGLVVWYLKHTPAEPPPVMEMGALLDSLRLDYRSTQHIWQGDTAYVQFDTLTGWISKPYLNVTFADKQFDTRVRTDRFGMRYNPAGQHRIVLVGDSFTFGWGVNDDQTAAYHLKAYTVACPGWNSYQQLSGLKRWLRQNPGDYAIVLVYNATDEGENYFLNTTPTFKEKGEFDEFTAILSRTQKLDWWERLQLMYQYWRPPGLKGDPVKGMRDLGATVFALPTLIQVEAGDSSVFKREDYLILDGHLNVEGNKKLAREIAKVIP